MRRAWLPVASYVVGIIAIQTLAYFSFSEDLFAKRAIHSSDWYWMSVSLLGQTWLWVGLARLSLDAIRGKSLWVHNLLAGPGIVFRVALVIIVVMMAAFLVSFSPFLLLVPAASYIRSQVSQEIVLVAVLLLLLGGAVIISYLSLVYSQIPWLIFDNRARYFDALRQSKELTKGVLWKLAMAFLVPGLLQLPSVTVTTLAGRFPDMFSNGFAQWLPVISWVWFVLASGFTTIFGAALYQQLLDHHRVRESSEGSGEGAASPFRPSAI